MHTAHLRGPVGMSSLMILHLHDPSNELQRLTSPSLLMLGLVELVSIVETNKMKGRS